MERDFSMNMEPDKLASFKKLLEIRYNFFSTESKERH